MAKISNIDSDLLRNVTEVSIVPIGQEFCNLENIIKEISVLDILNIIRKNEKDENILDIDILPNDIILSSKQKESTSGYYTTHSYTITVQPNQLNTYKKLNNFSNEKVLMFIKIVGEVNETYMLGSNEQGLKFSFEEYTTYLTITISGDTYFQPLRN